MSHITELIEYKQVADELHAVLIRCCGDTSTDSWHTMHSSVVNDERARLDSMLKAHIRVATSHKAAQIAATSLIGMKGNTVEHL